MAQNSMTMPANLEEWQELGSTMEHLGGKISDATKPMKDFGLSSIDAAAAFEQNMKHVDTVFGNSAAAVEDFSETALSQFGLSRNEALSMASTFGSMASSISLPQQSIAEMSIGLSGLASDMASYKNISVDEAMNALQGVFSGENTALNALGISMGDAQLNAFALQQGMQKTTSEMSEAEKAQLRYNFVMAQTKSIHGDYANSATGTADSMNRFQGAVDNLQTSIGSQLLPIITPVIDGLAKFINKLSTAPPFVQKIVAVLGLLVVSAGPVLSTLGMVTKNVKLLKGGFEIAKNTLGAFPKVLGPLKTGFAFVKTSIGSLSGVLDPIKKGFSSLSGVFSFLTSPMGMIIALIAVLAAAFIYLYTQSEDFRNLINQLVATLGEMLGSVLSGLMAFLQGMISVISSIISQLVTFLAPIIQTIFEYIMKAVDFLLPGLIGFINMLIEVFQFLIPIIMSIIDITISIISSIIEIVTPIIAFIIDIVMMIIDTISPIIDIIMNIFMIIFDIICDVWTNISGFIGGIIETIIGVISTIIDVVSGVFGVIFDIVSDIMDTIGGIISDVFDGINDAWEDLKGFVGGIFDGIRSAFDDVVSNIKNIINIVIEGINGAIDLINCIPGVSLDYIPYLLHGTDRWSGGFAVMNEGGRGELTYLPNGAQVIPHDLSMRYTKEAARANASSNFVIDYDRLINGLSDVISQRPNIIDLNVDGKALAQSTTPHVDRNLNNTAMLKGRYAQ